MSNLSAIFKDHKAFIPFVVAETQILMPLLKTSSPSPRTVPTSLN